MRRILIFLVVIGAAACTPSVHSPVGTPRAVIAPFMGDGAAALAKAGKPDAPTYEQVIGLFGEADVATREGQGGLLSYRLPACALALGFARDKAGALRLAVVEVGPLTPRAAAPSPADCAAMAQARRRSGAIT